MSKETKCCEKCGQEYSIIRSLEYNKLTCLECDIKEVKQQHSFPQKEEPKWLDRFYDLYIEGRKNKAPSCFIDYFKARSFLSQEISKAKQETIAKVREKIEGMKKEVNFDLPTTDYCYSDHDIHISYNQGLQDLSDKLKGI